MADCGCDEARANLENYLHGELANKKCSDIEDHLTACPPCQEEHAVGKTLKDKVKSACCETAPEALKRSIVAELERRS